MYAANKESHATLPALFKQPKALEHLRPVKPNGNSDTVRPTAPFSAPPAPGTACRVPLEHAAAVTWCTLWPTHAQNGTGRQPRLLQRLEYLLDEKLKVADTLSLPYGQSASGPQAGASNMRYGRG